MRVDTDKAIVQAFKSWSGVNALLTYACSIVSRPVKALVYVLGTSREVLEVSLFEAMHNGGALIDPASAYTVQRTSPPLLHKSTPTTSFGVS